MCSGIRETSAHPRPVPIPFAVSPSFPLPAHLLPIFVGVDLRLTLAIVLGLTAVAALLQLTWGYLNIPSLRDVPPFRSDDAPRLSIIVAARNEERHIEQAVRSLLAQTYPTLELIVVDDRSDDRTPGILSDLAAGDARLRIVRVDALPDGWLGKNNALQA